MFCLTFTDNCANKLKKFIQIVQPRKKKFCIVLSLTLLYFYPKSQTKLFENKVNEILFFDCFVFVLFWVFSKQKC